MNKKIIGMVMRALNGAPTVAKSKVADEVENALEKQAPKKAMDYKCPTCGEVFCTEMWEVDYCCSCGQRLKWRESE